MAKKSGKVSMQCDLQFSDFVDPYAIKDVVSSKTFAKGQWRSLTALKNFGDGVQKSVIPVDISQFKILVHSQVVAGNLIKIHKHDDEPQIRYVVSGSLKLNGETYFAGDWIIVPRGYEYEIYTDTGYITLAGYGQQCQGGGN